MIPNDNLYAIKLEKENQSLLQRIAEIEAENAKLLEEIQQLDSNAKQEVVKDVDLTEVLAKNVADDIEKEVHNDLIKHAELARQKLQEYEELMIKKKLNELPQIFIPTHKNNI
jgi:hypothetical protein